ncbi:hypothetical protein [Mycobacterium intracellulare]|uniref:hypothetical protein n=1 Tax=Mycobacterium intracellulare TaxID=1767 RepID=UPI000CE36176|nr:hypothetical protein [Mycobacterium intracellulare]
MDAGLGVRRIAEAARVDRSQIRNIAYGRAAQDRTYSGSARFCHPRTAAAVLAVPIPEPDPKAIAWREVRVAAAKHHEPKLKRHTRQPSWLERYTELKDLGYSDIEIMRRFGATAESMLRQMARYGVAPQPPLIAEARYEKDRRRGRSARRGAGS